MSAREKAKRLVALANDKATSIQERRTAAMVACRIIAKRDLLTIPLLEAIPEDKRESVEAAAGLLGDLAKAFRKRK